MHNTRQSSALWDVWHCFPVFYIVLVSHDRSRYLDDNWRMRRRREKDALAALKRRTVKLIWKGIP